MRALFTTLLIALTTTLIAWFMNDLWQNQSKNNPQLQQLRPVGASLYQQADIINTNSITLTNKNQIPHHFTFNRNYLWQCTTPYQDRADGINHINPLITFTLNAEIIDSIPLSQIDQKQYGFQDNWIKVQFQDKDNNNLATYKIGISSAWTQHIVTTDQRQQKHDSFIPTVFIIKENTPDDQTLYLVADNTLTIHSLFKNDFEGFRDHRPFALNRSLMEEVSIKRANTEIVVDRSTSSSPWGISKPLFGDTDKKEIETLLTHLSTLKATKLHTADNITLPKNAEDIIHVSIKSRHVEKPSTLTIYPSPPTATTCYATMNDRPGVIFEIPKQPTPTNKSAGSSLPTSVNEIRAKNMLTIDRKNIKQFLINPSFNSRIKIARKKPGKEYQLILPDNSETKVNDYTLSNLIAAISVLPVKSFVTDAATDLTQYNFQNPILDLTVIPFAGVPQRLSFAQKENNIYAYAHSNLSSVVWQVDPKTFRLISQKIWQWKDNTLWALLVNDISKFTIETPQNQQKLTINYDYIGDTFTGQLTGKDISSLINPIQAKYFLNNAHYITAQKRLGPNDTNASKALQNPILKITISSATYDNEGMPTNTLKQNTITIAKPNQQIQNPTYYYAKINNDQDYLIITPTTYRYLATNIFAEE